jgi:hypothetical protein
MPARDQLEELRRLEALEGRVTTSISGRKKEVDQMSGWEKFGVGMGNEGEMIGRKLANLGDTVGRKILRGVGVDMAEAPPADFSYSKETIQRRERETAPVNETVPGFIGGAVMDAGATAPLGAIGKGMEIAAGARGVPRAVGAVLRARPVQAATEGSVAGAGLADPEKRGEGAKFGAVAGTIGERIGSVLSRAMSGLVKRSPQAKALEQLADAYETQVSLPLATAASDEGYISPFMKFVYSKVLPSIPGAEGSLAKQSQRAASQFREIAMMEGAPGGMGSTEPGYAKGLPLTTRKAGGAGTDVHVTMKAIQDAFDKEYGDTIKSYNFNTPDVADVTTYLKKKFPGMDDATINGVAQTTDMLMSKLGAGGQLSGTNVIRAKTALGELGRKTDDEVTGAVFNAAQDYLDDIVRGELRIGGKPQNIKDLERYESLAEPWNNFLRVQRAAARAKNPKGEFTPQELTRASKAMASDRQLARGEAPMQELAALGEGTVGQSQKPPGFLERATTIGTLGTLGLIGGGPTGLAALWGGGRMSASPVVQDALMGQLNSQRAFVRFLREHPNKARQIGASLRNTMAAKSAEEETNASQQ